MQVVCVTPHERNSDRQPTTAARDRELKGRVAPFRLTSQSTHHELPSLSTFHTLGDGANCGMRRQHRAFLPTRQIAEMFSGKIDRTVWLIEKWVAGPTAILAPFGPGALTVRNCLPANRDTARYFILIARMNFPAARSCGGKALRRGHSAESLPNGIIPNVGAQNNALLRVEPGGGIPNLGDVAARPGDSPVDLMVHLPKAPISLKRDFSSSGIMSCCDGGLEIIRQVAGNLREY